MAAAKPVEWVSALLARFEEQLPCRIGPQTYHSRINVQQNKDSLIQISKCKFSLVISGLTRIMVKINEMRQTNPDFERDYLESLVIVLDTLEKCLSLQAAKPHHGANVGAANTGSAANHHHHHLHNYHHRLAHQCHGSGTPSTTSTLSSTASSIGASSMGDQTGRAAPSLTSAVTSSASTLMTSSSSLSSTGPNGPSGSRDEIMNVKLLLKEICQFLDMQPSDGAAPPTSHNLIAQIRTLASKVLYALSVNNFGAVFNKISGRLQELSVSSEENPDPTDIELIQHIDVDISRLTKLLNEAIAKFRTLKKVAQVTLMTSLEKAIWNWMDNYRNYQSSQVSYNFSLHLVMHA